MTQKRELYVGMTKLERHYLRMTFRYRKWKIRVIKRDNYTCVLCKRRSRHKVEAHHIKTMSKYPLQAFNIDNGVTLCPQCHQNFHRFYQIFEEYLK